MFLIFGLSVFFRTVRGGTFYCPRDGGDRAGDGLGAARGHARRRGAGAAGRSPTPNARP